MKKWEILGKYEVRNTEYGISDIVKVLLKNRGLTTEKVIEAFLNPKLEDVTIPSVGIDRVELRKAIARIVKAIKNQEQIVIYGDYDVDGICGSAILWETLHGLGAKVMPYIPHRIDEGYGLSVKGIDNILATSSTRSDIDTRSDLYKTKLIITVDNGIVANEAVDFANQHGIDVIITDHHVPPAGGSKKLPKAHAIVHTTKLCGTGVAWMLSRECHPERSEGSLANARISDKLRDSSSASRRTQNDTLSEDHHLELVALATIADLVPLLGANRTLTKFGLERLRQTRRIGLRALFDEAGTEQSIIGTYEVGHLIAPRLNAMGRLESAMDSLRLLCTKDPVRAQNLAHKLGTTNKERQLVTEETVIHAKSEVRSQKSEVRKLLFVAHESYQQGVIGLVAGKLVEEFYRPAIVVSKGEKYSKASARSVHGFNIIEFIRSASEFLVDAGGHPMAAGFTVETEKLAGLQEKLEVLAEQMLDGENLTRTLRIDCEINLEDVTRELYENIAKLEPFGMNNPQPTFVTRDVAIEDMRLVGAEGKHLKFRFSQPTTHNPQPNFDAIAFGMGDRSNEFHIGDLVDIVYMIDEDRWLAQRSLGEVGNGNNKLQLKIKDLKKPS